MSKRNLVISALTGLLMLVITYFLFISESSVQQINLSTIQCLQPEDGKTITYDIKPERIFAFGLTYATHIKETSQKSSMAIPPLFRKEKDSLVVKPDFIKMPGSEELLDMAEKTEKGLADRIRDKKYQLDPLLDYEVELAFVLLEEPDWDKINQGAAVPSLGYFLANDISSRFIQILGEGRKNRYDYWTASKSFDRFLPVNNIVWIPYREKMNSLLCVELVCMVNGKVRQKEKTSNLKLAPLQMLQLILRQKPDKLPRKGDVILTGTPGGVAFQVPGWKKKLADVLGLNRFTKLKLSMKTAAKSKRFLKAGDTVSFSGGILGTVDFQIK